MKVNFKNYKGNWFSFSQTVEELLNFTYDKGKVVIMYQELHCPESWIPKKQLGEKYDPEKHKDYQVISWSIGEVGKHKAKIIIFVDGPEKLIPQKLIDHSNGKTNKKDKLSNVTDKQMSIYDLGVDL